MRKQLSPKLVISIGTLTAGAITLVVAFAVSNHHDNQQRDAQAREMVRSLRNLPGPLYAAADPVSPADVIDQVETGNVVNGVPTYGVVRGAIGVQSNWPGGTTETCVPGKSVDPDPDSQVPLYTDCVRLTNDAVVALHAGKPFTGAASDVSDYSELYARFGTTTTSSTLEYVTTLTRSAAIRRARTVLTQLHPVDLSTFTDESLRGAARDQIDTDRMF